MSKLIDCNHCLNVFEYNGQYSSATAFFWCENCVSTHSHLLQKREIDIPATKIGVWTRPDNIRKLSSIPMYDNIVE